MAAPFWLRGPIDGVTPLLQPVAHALLQAGELAQHYARRAQEWNTGFFDASTVAQPDPRDGIHLDAANTRAIGEGLVPVVKSMLAL